MASSQARHHTKAPERRRRMLPVGVVVSVYVVVGMLWIFGGGPVADTVTEATSIPRWVVELGKGVLFVTVTALVLYVLMRRRADWVNAAAATSREDVGRLAESEHRNRLQATALSGTANAVVITGADGTIEWVNEAFEAMTGYPSSVAVGATPQLLKSGVQDEGFYRDLWDTILAGQVWQGQVVLAHGSRWYTLRTGSRRRERRRSF